MSFSKFIEEKLKKAVEAGELDNLKGAGKPLNLDVYFNTPEDVRAGYTLLKNNEFVPEEVGLLKEIGKLKESFLSITGEPIAFRFLCFLPSF